MIRKGLRKLFHKCKSNSRVVGQRPWSQILDTFSFHGTSDIFKCCICGEEDPQILISSIRVTSTDDGRSIEGIYRDNAIGLLSMGIG